MFLITSCTAFTGFAAGSSFSDMILPFQSFTIRRPLFQQGAAQH
ncbi:hypothetical protein SACS_1858 [Parasaccharibacter apium]|uniref:Uncharacterized protein n=1 Tax=Parasaccharibacter apium TaxID=1510841 RepID=A0A7U7IZU2_9PROT|nr:hypothetical protein SACS_1858 [Parasaccharibacter apium]